MSRVTLGLVTATLAGFAAIQPAAAGCCGWAGNCCAPAFAYQPVYMQPAPVVVQAPQQHVIVQLPQPQVVVQQPAPQVVFQQQSPVPTFAVEQGPVYAGPDYIRYSQPAYYADQPVRAYPYVPAYRPAYRPYRQGYRAAYRWGYRHGAYRGYKYAGKPYYVKKRYY